MLDLKKYKNKNKNRLISYIELKNTFFYLISNKRQFNKIKEFTKHFTAIYYFVSLFLPTVDYC